VEYLGLSEVSLATYPGPKVPFLHVRATPLCCHFHLHNHLASSKYSIVDFNLNAVGWANLWRLYYVWRGESHLVIQKLHQDYGPVVRIGPNLLDMDTPDLIKTIYNVKGAWKKMSCTQSPTCSYA
jgi:hypothetical protein